MQFVGIDERTRLMRPGGEAVTIEPGLYRVDVAGAGLIALVADDGTATLVEAEHGGHPLELDEPLAVAFDVEEGDRRLGVLLPGGLALVAGASRIAPADAPGQRLFCCPGFASAVLKKPLPDLVAIAFHKFSFGTIEPGTSPTPFAPQTFPPNWVRSVVVTCYVPPAGSWGPGGPGTASGVPVFQPGTEVRRGPYPGYLVSTTPVRVTCPGSEAGKVVELRVTEHVATIGDPTILSMTWQDLSDRSRRRRSGRFSRCHRRNRPRAALAAAARRVIHRTSAGAAHVIDRVRRAGCLRPVPGRELDWVAPDGVLRELSRRAASSARMTSKVSAY
jgi:hypothetical protein